MDGTLTDSILGITNGFKHAFSQFNIEMPYDDLRKCVGPPLADSVKRFGLESEEDIAKAIELYRQYYKETGAYENTLYPGIEDMLKALKEAGYTLAVSSAKYEGYVLNIIKHFKLEHYFAVITGSFLNETSVEKNKIITRAIEQLQVKDLSKVLMVGDTKYDAVAAKEIGIDLLGVLYGYGSKDELIDACNPVFLAETVNDITKYLVP